MITVALPWCMARFVAVAAFLVATAAARVEAQVGIGVGYLGVPFLYYTPQPVPSPTEYLYDRAKARISAYGNAVQQQAAASQMASHSDNPNSYLNRIRDYSGEETYQLTSRRSVSERTFNAALQSATPPTPATKQPTSQTPPPPLDAFFLPSGELDWPRDAADTEVLRPRAAEAEMAVKAVRSEIQSVGKAKAAERRHSETEAGQLRPAGAPRGEVDSFRSGERRFPQFPAVPPPGARSSRYRRILSRGEGELAGHHAM